MATYLLMLKARRGALKRKETQCPVKRNSSVKKAWAMYSGSTNCNRDDER